MEVLAICCDVLWVCEMVVMLTVVGFFWRELRR